jgi:hypothetical protein
MNAHLESGAAEALAALAARHEALQTFGPNPVVFAVLKVKLGVQHLGGLEGYKGGGVELLVHQYPAQFPHYRLFPRLAFGKSIRLSSSPGLGTAPPRL